MINNKLTEPQNLGCLLFIIIPLLIAVVYIFSDDLSELIIEDFEENSEYYNSIIEEIENSKFKFKDGAEYTMNELPLAIQEKLKKTKLHEHLESLTVSKNCYKQGELCVSFELVRLELCYSSLTNDPIRPKSGEHLNDYFIELWGLDKNWYLWKDNDFI